MSSPSPPSPTEKLAPDDDDTAEAAPLTMAASVILTNLPKDAKRALEEVGAGRGVPEKGMFFFRCFVDALMGGLEWECF